MKEATSVGVVNLEIDVELKPATHPLPEAYWRHIREERELLREAGLLPDNKKDSATKKESPPNDLPDSSTNPEPPSKSE